jgi:hypothetical protein
VAIALVQSITGNGATLTLNSVASLAHLTLKDSYFRNTGSSTAEAVPTDTQGTWLTGSSGTPGAYLALQRAGAGIFYQPAVASGTHTVTPETNGAHNATFCEWSGVATSSPLDASADAKTDSFAGTSQVTGTTGATAQDDELVLIALGLACNSGTTDVVFTDPVSGHTTLQKVVNDVSDIATFHAYKIISATGAQSATFNWTDTEIQQYCGAAIATFKAAQSAFAIAWTTA